MNNEINKRGKKYSSNQDYDHLEQQEKNKTQELVATEKATVEDSVDVITAGE